MHSKALEQWRSDRLARIDDLFAVHRAINGRGPRSGYVRAQIARACILMLAAEWQGFCRDLHDEAADMIASAASPPSLRRPLQDAFTRGRRVDVGNADAADIGNDFSRFNNMQVWRDVDALDKRNVVRRRRLRQLYAWRNAIAHHDFRSHRS
jgi:HEPN superfamily RiboL-PSP-like protein